MKARIRFFFSTIINKYNFRRTQILNTSIIRGAGLLLFTFVLILYSGWSNLGLAQIATYNFQLSEPGSLAPTSKDANVTAGFFTRVGLTANPTDNVFRTEGWGDTNNTSVTDVNDEYVEFIITPSSGFDVTYTTLTFDQFGENHNDAPDDWELRTSVDNYVSAIASGTIVKNVSTPESATLTGFTNISGSVTFRLYAYSAAGAFANNKFWRLDNVVANGTSQVDAITPTITSATVSPSSGFVKIGNVVTVTLDAAGNDVGLVEGSTAATINSVNVSGNFNELGASLYTFTYTIAEGDAPWTSGNLTIDLGLEDQTGNEVRVAALAANTLIGDGVKPAAPVVVSIADDSGPDGMDGITNDNTITISGTAEANASVEVFIDASSIGTTAANGTGDWTYDHTAVTLPDATYAITAQATDAAGNIGAVSALFPVTIINATPATPVVLSIADDNGTSGTDEITNDNTITITGTSGANASVEVFIDASSIGTTNANGSGDWTYDHTAVTLPDASYAITAQVFDAAGNTSSISSSLPITIITATPATPTVASIATDSGSDSSDEITNDNTITITGTSAANASVEVFINAGSIGTTTANGTGDWTYDHTAVTLPDATYAITAQVFDVAGNTSTLSASLPVTIDIVGATPVVVSITNDTGVSGADGITSDNTITITGTSEANASVQVFIDAGSIGTTIANGTGNWTYDHTAVTLADATYAITAQVTDVAGNVSAVSASFPITIDIVPAATPVVVSIADDNGASGTDEITNDNTITITGTSEANASVEVFIDAGSIGTITANGSGDWTYDHTAVSLADNTYAVTARATDRAGNTGSLSASLPITILTATPATPVVVSIADDNGISGIDEITNDNTITITGTSAANASVEIFIDASSIGTTLANGTGDWTYDHTAVPLADATYAITAQVFDVAGNTSSLSSSLPITVDQTNPTVSPFEFSIISPTTIEFTMSEELGIAAGAVSGFSVGVAGTLSTSIYSDKGATNLITLTGSGFSDGTSTVTYTPVGTAIDIAGNELLGFTEVAIINVVNLGPGDIAFTGYNGQGNPDGFSFVLLKDIRANTIIKFTDNGWQGATNKLTADESTISWSTATNLYAGTEISIQENASTGTSLVVSHGTATADPSANLNFKDDGDQILAYQGTSSTPTFLAGIHVSDEEAEDATTKWNTVAKSNGDDNRSALPTVGELGATRGLTNGINAISFAQVSGGDKDNVRYTGDKFASTPLLLATAINDDPANSAASWDDQRDNTSFALNSGANYTLPPDIVTLSPGNGARMKEDFATIQIDYGSNISKDLSFGGGNITITNQAAPAFSVVIPASSASVTTAGSVVSIVFDAQTILLTDGFINQNLIDNTTYEINVDGFLFVNSDGNHNEPIVGSTDWTFIYDKTPPLVTSVVRKPATSNPEIDDNGVVFVVTFNDAVTGVNPADFTSTGTAAGVNSFSVSPNSATEYEVTVTNIDLSDAINIGGDLRLDVIDDGTILDIAGNTLGGLGNQPNYILGEAFTIIHPDPLDHVIGLVVSAVSLPTSSTVTLEWTESTNNQKAQGFLIVARSSGGTFLGVADNSYVPNDGTIQADGNGAFNITAGDLTYSDGLGNYSYTFPGLFSGSQYFFQVIPFTNDGVNIFSGNQNEVLYKTDGTIPEVNATTLVAFETTIALVSANPTISSVNNDQASIIAEAGNFVINIKDDGALPAEDNTPTLINEIIIRQNVANDEIVNWTEAILDAELSDGVTTITSSSFDDTSITFTGIANGSGQLGEIVDNGTKTYTLKVWLKTNLTGTLNLDQTIDQLNFVFGVNEVDIKVENAGSSHFKALQAANSGVSNNKVEVRATEFAINQVVSTEGINVPLVNTPTISVGDANNNLDLNYIADGGSFTVTRLGVSPTGFSTNATFTFDNNALLNMSSFQYTTTGDGRLHIEGINGLATAMILAENTANAVEVMHTNFSFYNISQFKPQGATTLQSAIPEMTLIGFSLSSASNGTNPVFDNITIDFKDGFNIAKDISDILENVRIYEVAVPSVINPIINIDYTPVPGASINAGSSTASTIVIDGFNEQLDIINPSYYVIVADVSAAANEFTSGMIKATITPNINNLAPNNGSLTGGGIQGTLFDFQDSNSPIIIITDPVNASISTPFSTTAFTFTFDEPVTHIFGANPKIELREFIGDNLVVYDSVSISPGVPVVSSKDFTISFWDNTTDPLNPVEIALGESVRYYILIDPDEFSDASNNFHLGLTNKGLWNFTTTDTSPPDFIFVVDNTELIENSYDFGFDIKVKFDEPAIAYALALPDTDPDPVDYNDIITDGNAVSVNADNDFTDYFIPIRGLSTGDYNIYVAAEDFGGNKMTTVYNTATSEAQKVPATAAAFTDLVSEPDINICVGESQDIIQPITIIEGSDDDFSAGTLDLILPNGFEFDMTSGGATIINSPSDITISSFSYRNNTILSLELTGSGTARRDEIRVTGLRIKALTNAVDGSIVVIEDVTGSGSNDIPYADNAANLIVSNLPEALFTLNPAGNTINSNSAVPIALTQVSPIDPFLGESYIFGGNGVNNDSLFVNLAPLGDNTLTLTQTFDGGCQAFGSQIVKIIDAQIVGLDFKYCEDFGLVNIPQHLDPLDPGNTFNGTYDLESVIADVSQIMDNPGDISSWDPVNFVFDPGIAIPDTSTAEFVAIDFIGLYRNSFDPNDSIPITQTVWIYPAPAITLESGNLADIDLDGIISACEDFGDITFTGKPQQSLPSIAGIFTLINSIGTDATLAHVTNTGDGTAIVNTQDIANDIASGFGPGVYTLSYSYSNSSSTCLGVATLDIIINPKPIANFSLLGRPTLDGCVDEVITFQNESDILLNSTFTWVFDDDNAAGTNGNLSSAQDPNHYYISDGVYNINLTTTTDKGCASEPVIQAVSVGNNPVTAFDFEQVAIGTPTIFTNTTLTDIPTTPPQNSINTNVDTLIWTIGGVFNNMVVDDGTDPTLTNPFSHSFTVPGTKEVILTAITDKNCSVSDTLDFFIVPEEALSDASQYLEDFDDNSNPDNGDWIAWGGSNSSWGVGLSGGDSILSTSNFWVTGVDTLHNNDEESYVYSPVFNITDLARPMLQLSKYAHMNVANGVVIEYTAVDLFGNSADGVTGDWKLLGSFDTGDEWYDFEGISNIGGNQQTGQYGWSGSDEGWERSKHTLTQTKADAPDQNNVRVQFRVSFNSGSDNFGEFNGFGFDDILIGNRTRTVLLENFSSMAQGANTKVQNTAINDLAITTLGATELVVLTYHTSFDGPEALNANSPTASASRALYYGVSTTPRVVIDGKTGRDESADNSQLLYTDWGEREFNIRTLQIAPFTIELELDRNNVNDGLVRIFADLTATIDIDSNFVVQIAVVEKKIKPSQFGLDVVESGEDTLYNTVLKLLPNAGGTRFTTSLLKDDKISLSEIWNPTNIAPNPEGPTRLEVIVFVQDENSKEILQAERIDFTDDVILALDEDLTNNGIALYPNPADRQITIKLANKPLKEVRAIIFDNTGKQIEDVSLNAGQDLIELNTLDYRPGIYMFTLPTKTGSVMKRFVISHR